MIFFTNLFKPKNKINDLFEKSRNKIEKENAAQIKKSTAYINKITRKLIFKKKKEKLLTVPVISFFLKIFKFFTPVKKEGIFSWKNDIKVTFTSDEINDLYSRVVNKREEELKTKRKENAAYLRRISKQLKIPNNKK